MVQLIWDPQRLCYLAYNGTRGTPHHVELQIGCLSHDLTLNYHLIVNWIQGSTTSCWNLGESQTELRGGRREMPKWVQV